MNNLLQLFSIISLISVSLAIFIYGFCAAYQWVEEDNDTYAKNYILWVVLVVVWFLSFAGIQVSAKNLDELECGRNNGNFETWDNGFSWECYNPNLIQQENNSRIILSEEEQS